MIAPWCKSLQGPVPRLGLARNSKNNVSSHNKDSNSNSNGNRNRNSNSRQDKLYGKCLYIFYTDVILTYMGKYNTLRHGNIHACIYALTCVCISMIEREL